MRGFSSPEIPFKTNMVGARLECEGRDGVNTSDWLYVYPIASKDSFDCARWYCPLEMNSELRGMRIILT